MTLFAIVLHRLLLHGNVSEEAFINPMIEG